MKPFILILLFSLFFMIADAQVNLTYQTPHQDISSLADVDLAPSIRMDRTASKAILLYRDQYKSIGELSEKEMRLAGLRINPKTFISSRTRYFNAVKYFDVEKGLEKTIEGLNPSMRIANISWSKDQSKIAFTNTVEEGVELWVIDMQEVKAWRLTEPVLNANMGEVVNWQSDNKTILTSFKPASIDPLIDTKSAIPTGPTISENDGKKAQNRTYQDLLKNPTDEANFKTLATSEIWKVSLDGTKEKWKDANMYSDISISPDGQYVLVSTIQTPFSYLVPFRRFPSVTDVYSIDGRKLKTFLKVPLVEDLPKGFMSVRTGPRRVTWRSDRPSTLYWVEALDGGDANIESEYRDAVYQQDVPFTADKSMLVKTKERFSGIQWGTDDFAVVMNYWWNSRNLRTEFFNPSDPNQAPVLFNERNYQDRYSDPGFFVTSRDNEYSRPLLEFDGDELFLIGDGYSKKGKHPFVDKYNIKTGHTTRIYQNDQDEQLESLATALDVKSGKYLTSLESQSQFPNFYIRDINNNSLTPITQFSNPFQAIADVHKEVITYKREDGVELSGTLYLPVGYEKGKKYPMIMWAYPVEYKDKKSASQVTASSNEFTYPWYGSPLFWVNRGYVILDDAAFPIIGEGEQEPNDSFRKQLVDNAKAGIDAVDALGYIDRDRVAVGGHSYGAFMTANLLSHSNLFAAGIARSGAYNRTLTPFGFQSEERNYWEAPDIYYNMSPFMHADKMKTPLLLIHGEADNNSGTYPMQSERYFNALKGLGATVRLVMLPKESHGYVAKESIMHMLWEQDRWLEKYVKQTKGGAD